MLFMKPVRHVMKPVRHADPLEHVVAGGGVIGFLSVTAQAVLELAL